MPELKTRLKVHITPLLGDVYLIPEKDLAPTGDDIVIVPTKENARRLAACWNACLALTTEQIEELAAAGGKAIERARTKPKRPVTWKDTL